MQFPDPASALAIHDLDNRWVHIIYLSSLNVQSSYAMRDANTMVLLYLSRG